MKSYSRSNPFVCHYYTVCDLMHPTACYLIMQSNNLILHLLWITFVLITFIVKAHFLHLFDLFIEFVYFFFFSGLDWATDLTQSSPLFSRERYCCFLVSLHVGLAGCFSVQFQVGRIKQFKPQWSFCSFGPLTAPTSPNLPIQTSPSGSDLTEKQFKQRTTAA